MKIATTDKERISNFIELLPEQNMDDFLNYSLFNARYTQKEFDFINKYLSNCDKVFFQFNNTDLNSLKKIFDDSLKKMMNVVVNSFFITEFGLYILFPELKNSLDDEKLNAWHKKLGEVNDLADVVWDNYKNLLEKMRKYLEEVEKKEDATINIKNNSGNVNIDSPNSQQSIEIAKNDLTPEVLEILKNLQKAVDEKDETKINALLKELKAGAKNIFWGIIANGLSVMLKINEISNDK